MAYILRQDPAAKYNPFSKNISLFPPPSDTGVYHCFFWHNRARPEKVPVSYTLDHVSFRRRAPCRLFLPL